MNSNLKRTLAAIAAGAMCCNIIPNSQFGIFAAIPSVTAAAEVSEAASFNDLNYIVDDDGNITITGYTGSSSYLEIPETIDGKIVTKIGKCAFEDNQTITEAVLPDTIVMIDYKAFDSCQNLVTINFPDSLTTIGSYAFTSCKNLKEIDLNQVQSIGECAFQLCISLSEIFVPSSLQYIPDHAFHGCSGVTTLIFAEGVTYIEATAALNMYSLTTLVIPASVTEIGEYALGYTYYHPDYTRLDTTVYGFKGTAAESYALENGFNFVLKEMSNLGDVNDDGLITPTDAAKTLSAYADEQTTGVSGLTELQFKNADVNKDSVITPTDAASILSYYAYISTTTDVNVLGIEEFLNK